ncbi:MAG: fumarate reductase/succinate dehydrogenase flavoprotein subunit, partial [Bacteroidetes bacterium SW_11_45_7]
GANRLGASALMQGLSDGYFVLPMTIGNYLSAEIKTPVPDTKDKAFDDAEKNVQERLDKILSIKGSKTVDYYHKQLGDIMWNYCGMSRNREGLEKAKNMVKELREDFWQNVKVPGSTNEMNGELEKAGRVADFLELGELIAVDALNRYESCGGHFREEYQTEEGEALRDDEGHQFVSAWEFKGEDNDPELHKEPLEFDIVKPTTRSYK